MNPAISPMNLELEPFKLWRLWFFLISPGFRLISGAGREVPASERCMADAHFLLPSFAWGGHHLLSKAPYRMQAVAIWVFVFRRYNPFTDLPLLTNSSWWAGHADPGRVSRPLPRSA